MRAPAAWLSSAVSRAGAKVPATLSPVPRDPAGRLRLRLHLGSGWPERTRPVPLQGMVSFEDVAVNVTWEDWQHPNDKVSHMTKSAVVEQRTAPHTRVDPYPNCWA
ncbi:hypothetical protein J0S82_001671 [Galemys pyrenaicus]|uniref:KRAB domain-containing protein n=1 Tax=Galemys pyrenaicus TaxID=202257 RepID=A0A8J5ZV87_GALPY|nr:hypothetical protein J0S82_001671 [Galemys pyrenaicus]